MKAYRFAIQKKSYFAPVIFSLALCMTAITIYSLIRVAYYAASVDHWLQGIAGVAFALCMLPPLRRHSLFLILPAALLALTACMNRTLTISHWAQIVLFLLLLILLLLRLPRWVSLAAGMAGACLGAAGLWNILDALGERVSHLAGSGNATMAYIFPLVCRSVGGEGLELVISVLVLFALKPKRSAHPNWLETDAHYYWDWK